MAVFQHLRDYQRIDYRLLRENTINLYLNAVVLAKHISWLKSNSYKINAFDCSEWNDELEVHRDFFAKLNFPEYYGENLNAFNDCIIDIEIADEGGRCLIFYHYDSFAKRFPDASWNILDIIERQSRTFLLNGQRFLVLLHLDNRESFAAVGCHHLNLNFKER